MRKHDEINGYRKEFVYEQYSRIVSDCKDYDKITKTKMLDAIYDVYRNCDNIFDLCTTRELKYLKLIINASSSMTALKKNMLGKDLFYMIKC